MTPDQITAMARETAEKMFLRDYQMGSIEELKRRRPDIADDVDRELAEESQFIESALRAVAEQVRAEQREQDEPITELYSYKIGFVAGEAHGRADQREQDAQIAKFVVELGAYANANDVLRHLTLPALRELALRAGGDVDESLPTPATFGISA